jgi:hypothetical protein
VLTKFDRHLALVRPNIVVIYDELEARDDVQWELLLHSRIPSQEQGERLELEHQNSYGVAQVYATSPLETRHSYGHHSKAIDHKKKYGKGVPPEHHHHFTPHKKSSKMRFLTLIQMSPSSSEQLPIQQLSSSQWKVGALNIQAQLDSSLPSYLQIEKGESSLHVNRIPKVHHGSQLPEPSSRGSLLRGTKNGQMFSIYLKDQLPKVVN